MKASHSSISLGVILRITRTKQAPVLVGFTAIYIIADLDQETLHMKRRVVCPPILSHHQMHVPTAFPAPWDYLCSSEYCTISIDSAWGVTCDQMDEISTTSNAGVTWDMV